MFVHLIHLITACMFMGLYVGGFYRIVVLGRLGVVQITSREVRNGV